MAKIPKTSDFVLVIAVDGYDPTIKESIVTNVSIDFPNECKNACQHWMINRVVDRTMLGLDVNFRPFAPRSDGSPTNLTRTGAMLKNVKAARGSDLRATGSLVVVGISCYLKDRGFQAHYPWILHNGVNEENYKSKRVEVVDRMIKRKQDRLQRKTEAIAATKETTMKWEYLMDLKRGIEKDITELQKRRAEIEARDIQAMPPREWWGLDETEEKALGTALEDWVSEAVAARVVYACHPDRFPMEQVQRAIAKKFIDKFSGGGSPPTNSTYDRDMIDLKPLFQGAKNDPTPRNF